MSEVLVDVGALVLAARWSHPGRGTNADLALYCPGRKVASEVIKPSDRLALAAHRALGRPRRSVPCSVLAVSIAMHWCRSTSLAAG